MRTSKADMVRLVVNEYGCQHTTRWVRKKIREVFGVEITPQQIHALLGRYCDRSALDSSCLIQAARDFKRLAGDDIELCVRLLKVRT
jgi:hypothetical protein